ncbi:MAG: flagellar export protein FliJ [Candidatus Gastranaerophilales bacterium]|nr:flagellar export protein FliJ [Candidatus Gastranaerophilales bacterium]
MKKFKFKLQIVLDKRQKELEDRQLEMAQIQSILKQQTDKLEMLINSQNLTKSALETMLGNSQNIDLVSIKIHQDYIDKLSGDIQNQHKIISDTEQELEAKQQEVIEALKAAKMLEKLKEKHHREFLVEFEFQQQKELEDITQARFRLGRGEKVN